MASQFFIRSKRALFFATNTRPRISREVTTALPFILYKNITMADDGSHGRAWPEAKADLTNSVRVYFWDQGIAWANHLLLQDPRACPTSWTVQAAEKGSQRR
jgi:hypothetical protein